LTYVIQKPMVMPTLPSELGCPIRWRNHDGMVILEAWVGDNCFGFTLTVEAALAICENGIHEAICVRDQRVKE
jgi:hypothetical protein